jgi:hypothetical protein
MWARTAKSPLDTGAALKFGGNESLVCCGKSSIRLEVVLSLIEC